MLTVALASVCLALPAHLGIIDAYREPACERCAGNRGVELATRDGAPVAAGLSGTASWVGPVANRLYVVLRSSTDPRVRITYGGLASTTVQIGDMVGVGHPVGIARSDLFVGMRIGNVHVDPMRYAPASPDTAAAPPSGSARPRFRFTLGGRASASCGASLPSR